MLAVGGIAMWGCKTSVYTGHTLDLRGQRGSVLLVTILGKGLEQSIYKGEEHWGTLSE